MHSAVAGRKGGPAARAASPFGAPIATFAEVPREEKASIHLLVIDDDRPLREGIASLLQADGFHVTTCARGDLALELVSRTPFDIVLIDLYMAGVPGLEILRALTAAHPETIAIVATGEPTVETSVEALRCGAWDYLPKPFSAIHLQVLVERAALLVHAQRAGSPAPSAPLDEISPVLGPSAAFRRAIDLARRVARTDASVMLVGESGTGKELVAEYIHRHSRRAARRLVAVNCAALPEQLLESELFGHDKGAFTGAVRDKAGLIETAHGSTFFLDEITEMPVALQAKLLRVVQDGVVRRVGSESPGESVDVRFLSATNRDPREAIRDRHLREDLYFRLNVFPITIPPLRERQEDIPVLAEHFLSVFWTRHRRASEPRPRLGPSAIDALVSRRWRGNVRELQNVIEHLAVIADPDEELAPEALPPEEARDATSPADVLQASYHEARAQVLARFEAEYSTRLIARAAGNLSRAARLADVDRATLYRILGRQGVHRHPPATRRGADRYRPRP